MATPVRDQELLRRKVEQMSLKEGGADPAFKKAQCNLHIAAQARFLAEDFSFEKYSSVCLYLAAWESEVVSLKSQIHEFEAKGGVWQRADESLLKSVKGAFSRSYRHLADLATITSKYNAFMRSRIMSAARDCLDYRNALSDLKNFQRFLVQLEALPKRREADFKFFYRLLVCEIKDEIVLAEKLVFPFEIGEFTEALVAMESEVVKPCGYRESVKLCQKGVAVMEKVYKEWETLKEDYTELLNRPRDDIDLNHGQTILRARYGALKEKVDGLRGICLAIRGSRRKITAFGSKVTPELVKCLEEEEAFLTNLRAQLESKGELGINLLRKYLKRLGEVKESLEGEYDGFFVMAKLEAQEGVSDLQDEEDGFVFVNTGRKK